MKEAQLRRAALALPEVVEVETWDQATFRVGKRMFCILGADGVRASVRATPEQQQELLSTDPAVYSFAPYVGRHGWVLIDVPKADAGEIAELLEEGWRQIAPKRLLRDRWS
jgi:hypothetical protein